MGQRHNRKRIRSRPRRRNRNRDSTSSATSFYSPSPSPFQLAGFNLPPTSCPAWYDLYPPWPSRSWSDYQRHEDAIEAQRLRIFGGEAGDEVSLCEPMLRVVMDLFDDIDYVDP